jgi:hypothetical protein
MMYLDGWINSEGRALVKEKKNKNDICFFGRTLGS